MMISARQLDRADVASGLGYRIALALMKFLTNRATV